MKIITSVVASSMLVMAMASQALTHDARLSVGNNTKHSISLHLAGYMNMYTPGSFNSSTIPKRPSPVNYYRESYSFSTGGPHSIESACFYRYLSLKASCYSFHVMRNGAKIATVLHGRVPGSGWKAYVTYLDPNYTIDPELSDFNSHLKITVSHK